MTAGSKQSSNRFVSFVPLTFALPCLIIDPDPSTSQHADCTRNAAHAVANLMSCELNNQTAAAKHIVSATDFCFSCPWQEQSCESLPPLYVSHDFHEFTDF